MNHSVALVSKEAVRCHSQTCVEAGSAIGSRVNFFPASSEESCRDMKGLSVGGQLDALWQASVAQFSIIILCSQENKILQNDATLGK